MKRLTGIIEVLIIPATAVAMLLVPASVIPPAAWPLTAGVILLALVSAGAIRAGLFRDQDFAPTSAGILFTMLGTILFIRPGQFLTALFISLGMTLVWGIGWAAWRAVNHRG